MAKEFGKLYPEHFTPAPPKLSFWGRSLGLLSLGTKPRYKLWLAFRTKDNSRLLKALGMLVLKLLKKKDKDLANIRKLAVEILHYLVWEKTRVKAFDDASRWLAELDGLDPPVKTRVSLRWQLMVELWRNKAFEVYVRQAKVFLADQLLDWNLHRNAVLDILDKIYEGISPEECAKVLVKSSSKFKRTPEFQTVRSLCKYPRNLQYPGTSSDKKTEINTGNLYFSEVMVTDAKLLTNVESAIHYLLCKHQKGWAEALPTISDFLTVARNSGLTKRFPDMVFLLDVMLFTLRTVKSWDGSLKDALMSYKLPDSVTPFVSWLFARAVLVSCREIEGSLITRLNLKQPEIAWLVDAWLSNSSQVGILNEETTKVISARLDLYINNLPGSAKEYAGLIRALRAGRYRQFNDTSPPNPIDSIFIDLGEIADRICVSEMHIEIAYALARRDLAGGYTEESLRQFIEIKRQLEEESAITQALWTPVICYWLAIGKAHLGQEDATGGLENLVNGRMGRDARAQLALLSIQKNNIEKAEEWIHGLADDIPAVLYSRALVYSRNGNNQKAEGLLRSKASGGILKDSPYALPSKRLLAALSERKGRLEEAEQQHFSILQATPNDPITNARLGRLLFCRSYKPQESGCSNLGEPMGDLLVKGSAGIEWCKSYDLLFKLHTCCTDDLGRFSKVVSNMSTMNNGIAYRQVMARRFFQARKASEARQLIMQVEGGKTPWFERTRHIVNAWYALASVNRLFQATDALHFEGDDRGGECESGTNMDSGQQVLKNIFDCFVPNLQNCLANLNHTGSDGQDGELSLWCRVLKFALETCLGSQGELSIVFPECTTIQDDSWAFDHVLQLLSSTGDNLSSVAEFIIKVLQKGENRWSDRQRNLLGALSAQILGKGNPYLGYYKELVEDLDDLPVDGQQMWLQAANIWYKQGKWEELTEGELPECIEDLTNPEARLLIGLAYARLAIETRDYRQGAKLVKQGREMLSPLVP